MRKLVPGLLLISGLLGSNASLAQAPLWQKVDQIASRGSASHAIESYFYGDLPSLRNRLAVAPAEFSGDYSHALNLPMPDGSLAQFIIVDSPVMNAALAARFPQIRTYKVFGIDDASASGRVDITPHGFHAMLHTAQGRITIRPTGGLYQVSARGTTVDSTPFQCLTTGEPAATNASPVIAARQSLAQRLPDSYQVYRLAVSATFEYVNTVGGSLNAAMAEIVTAINRVNQIYERDLGIRLELIANNDLLIDTDGSAGFSNNNALNLLGENQAWVDARVGSANYDIGHILSSASGGLASVGAACGASKARGVSGHDSPTEDPFYVDYIAHEIGHQLGAQHTFNGVTGSCATGRTGSQAFEPGSGSTIMGYAGICGAENLQLNSEDTFHSASIAQIQAYTSLFGACYSTLSTNNPNQPVAVAGADRIVPKGTAFRLSGGGSDADGDTLSYQWDQIDLGSATSAATFGTDLGDNPLFRSFAPQASPIRDLPALGTQVDGLIDLSEALPCTARDLNFRLTVRDGKSGQASDELTLTVDDSAGPFQVTSHANASTIVANAGTVDVTWNVANTDNGVLNCTAVDIDLLTFAPGHGSYGVTRLLTGTANNGLATISIANSANTHARFRVSCSNNIFYDISDADLVIQGGGVFPTDHEQTFFNINGEAFAAPPGQCGASVNLDATPPVIVLLGTSPVDLELGTPYTDAGASASDDIDGDISANIATANNVNVNVVGNYSVTYNVSDAAGNAAAQVTRSVNVTPDVTLPIISVTGTNPVNIELGTPYTDAGASASDNFDGDISANLIVTSNVDVYAVGNYTVTYNVSDAAGNAALQVTRSVNLTPDVTVPVISLAGPATVNIELGTPYVDAGADAYDNIDGDITVNLITVSNVDVNAVGSYSVTYNASDAAGNAAPEVTRIVNVTPDVTLPVISLTGASTVNIELGTPYVDAGASASDNIDGDLSANIATVSNVNVNAVGNYSVTYNVNDTAGNAALQVIRSVNVTPDITRPVISLVGASPVNIELGTPYVDAGASASDNIDGDLTLFIASVSNVNVNVVGSYSVTYSVSDTAGNTALQVTRSVNVTPDVTLPVISLAGASTVNLELGTPYTDAGASATDNIDGDLSAGITTVSNVNVDAVGSYSITYDVSDAAGNVALQVTRIVNVTPDITLPVISLTGSSPVNIELGTPYIDAGASASDNIDGDLSAIIASVSNVNVNAVGSYSVTYNVTDAAGNAALQVTRSVNVTPDVTLPVISLAGASTVNIELGTPYVDAGASASDNIDGDLTANIATISNVNVNAVGNYSVTYNVSDAAGNAALQVTRSVNVTPDVTLPVISLVGVSPVDIELGTPYTDAGASASDNIDGDLSANIATVNNVNVNVVGSYSVTYNVSDAAGNAAAQVTRSVNVTADVTLPVISLTGASPINIELGTPYTDAGASASDNIDGDISANITTVNNVNVNVVGSYSVTYNVNDAAGNAAAQVTRSVNITPDATLPIISLSVASPVNIELGTPYTDAGASASDNIDGDLSANIATVSNVDVNVVGSYSVTYNVSDAAGNAALQVTRTVNVTADVTLPVISLVGVSPVDIELGTPYTDAGASASDNIDGDLSANIAAISNVDVNAVGSYSVTYNVSDAAGNAALQVTRTVNVTPDVTLPVISLSGASPVDIELGSPYTDAGASASDNIDGDLSASIVTVSNVNINAVGSYSVTYNVSDAAGNTALQVTRTVNVTPDVTSPVISLSGVSPVSIELGTPYNDAGAGASDNIDGDITTNIASVNNVNVNAVGSYSVTYSVSDAAGNAALQITRTVNVTPDVTLPVISLVGVSPVDIELGTPYTDAGASASDNIDGDLTASITTVSNLNVNAVGNYSVTYNVSDAAGNIALQVTRSVNVTADVTLPVVTAPASIIVAAMDADGTAATNATIATFLGGANANDSVDGPVTVTNNAPAVFPLGVTTVTFSASDSAGNIGTVQATVTIQDQTAPIINLLGASSMTLEVGEIFTDPGTNVSDNVDSGLIATVNGSVNTGTIGLYSLTYNVSDAAGNAAVQVTRSISVQDSLSPVVTVPANIIIAATDIDGTPATSATIVAFLAGASANDAADGAVAVTNDAPVIFPLGITTVTFSAMDSTGNFGVAQATVTITDQGTPEISLLGVSPVNIELGTPYVDAGANATDNIDGDLSAGIATVSNVNVNAVGSYSVTYNVSDTAGNAALQVTRTVNVTPDVTLPEISLAGVSPVNIELGTPYVDAGASASDNIDGDLSANIAAISNVNVNAVGSYSVTYNVSDAAGNAALQVTRTVNVTPDVTLPVISLSGVSPVSIELGTPYNDAGAGASDNIDGDITTNIASVNNVNVNAVGSYSVTYSVSDAAGNAALQITRTVNVTPDVTLPVISLVGVSPVDIELGTPYTDAGASASDNFDGDISANLIVTSNVDVYAVGNYSVTYNVTDAAGNAALQVTRSVNVTPDVTLPVISLAGASTVDIELGSPYIDAGASASDNIDGDLSANLATVSNVNVNAVGSYSVTYNVSDAAGNAALQVTRIVNITADVTLPVISLAGVNPVDIELGTPYVDAGASASDNIDGDLGANITIASNVNVNAVGNYSVTYNVSDAAGNAALQITRTVNVTPDVTLPVISLTGVSPVDIELGTPYVDAGASASDNIDGDLSQSIATASNVNINAVGSYSVTYNVSDAAGNAALQVTRNVNVTADVTPPVISLAGASPVDIELGTPYADAGAGAYDNIDGDLSASIVTVSNVNINIVGNYSITYNVSDTAGNAAPQVTRSVNVTADVTAPTVTAPQNIIVAAEDANGSVATNAAIATFLGGVNANDSVDGALVVTNDAPPVFPLGVTTVTFSASDNAGNTGTAQATLTVTDQDLPVITLLGSSSVDIELGTPYEDAGSSVSDNVDNGLVASVSGSVNTDRVGLYLLTYNVSDAAGNAAVAVARTVNVTADVTAPMVTAPASIIVAATDASGTAATQVAIAGFLTAAMASDSVDGTLLAAHNAPGQFPLGVTTITFSASDNTGNTGTAQATVTVADQSRPVITLLGTSVNIELGRSYLDAGSNVSDNVDTDLVATVSGTVNTDAVGLYLLTYNVSDSAGNAAITVVRSVNVTADVTAPTIIAPANLTVATIDASGTAATQAAIANFLTAATASDTVDGTLVTTHNAPAQFPLGVTPVTFSASDNAGNTGTAQATVTVTDQQQPVITLLGSYSVTIELGTPYEDAGSSVSDNVETDLVATVSGSVNTDVIGLYLLTYNVSDAAGNAATTIVRGVLVQDSSVPDDDQDGIPNFIDGISDPTLLQSRAGITDSWLLSTQAGLSLHLGSIARALGTYGAAVSAQDIEIYEFQVSGIVQQAIDTYSNIGGYFDFEIHGLSQPGDSALIVIPQYAAIPPDAVFRRYAIGEGWLAFVEDTNNQLFSVAGAPGICPLPGDPAYIPGLNPGHRCVQLLIEDGGGNDADGVSNGVILDPGGVAVIEKTPTPPGNAQSGSGGGSLNLPILILLILARPLLMIRGRVKLGGKS